MAAILVALSTSLPELFIAVAAGFSGQPEISGELTGGKCRQHEPGGGWGDISRRILTDRG